MGGGASQWKTLPPNNPVPEVRILLQIFGRLGWVLSVLSSYDFLVRRRLAHREKTELLAWYQRTLDTPPLLILKGLGSEFPLKLTIPTGMRSGGIYLKVTRDLEGKKCQGRTTVFSDDNVPIRCPTRSRLVLMHQEEQRRRKLYEDSNTTTVMRWEESYTSIW